MFKRKVRITREQAMAISCCLENFRRFNEETFVSNRDILRFEDNLDAQIWGSKYVAHRKKNRGA